MVVDRKNSDSSPVVENGEFNVPEHEDLKIVKSTYKTRLEFGFILMYFAINLSIAVYQNEVLYLSCTSVYGYSEKQCKDLGFNNSDAELKDIENIVQPYASTIFMTESIIQAVLPAILALLAGSWSDRFGRKPIMLITGIGYACFFIIKAIIAAFALSDNMNPWIFVVASVPVALTGGSCLWSSSVYCYVADLTTHAERPVRMCIMAGAMAVGTLIGSLVSSYLYAATNACVVYVISAIAAILAVLFIVFFINESVRKEQLSTESKLSGFFDYKLLVEMFKTIFKKRPNFERSTIWCILLPMTVFTFDQAGAADVFFLFLRKKFGMTVQQYTTFVAVRIVIDFVGGVAAIIILQMYLKWKQTTMSILAYASCVIISIFYATATETWLLYLGVSLAVLFGIATPMGQSMLSNTVAPCDIGKLFALMTALGAIAPLISSPVYTAVYNATLDTYPGAYTLISVGLFSLCFLAAIFVHVADHYYPNVNKDKSKKIG